MRNFRQEARYHADLALRYIDPEGDYQAGGEPTWRPTFAIIGVGHAVISVYKMLVAMDSKK